MTESERGKACMIKPIKATSVPSRRKFDETFKAEAVHNSLSSGKSAAGPKPGSSADLQSQLDAARREVRHLREQRDILKKTLGILSEPSPSVTNGSPR